MSHQHVKAATNVTPETLAQTYQVGLDAIRKWMSQAYPDTTFTATGILSPEVIRAYEIYKNANNLPQAAAQIAALEISNAQNAQKITLYETKIIQAESARRATETSIGTAESKRKETETLLHQTESKRKETETLLHQTESKRKETETLLHQTESKRKETETLLHQTESKRKETETLLHQTESKRKETETLLHQTESKRKETETLLHQTESKRKETEILLSAANAEIEALRNRLTAVLSAKKSNRRAQYVRDFVSAMGVLFAAFSLMFLFNFSVVGWFLAICFSGFMLAAFMEIRKPEKHQTSSNLIAFFYLIAGGEWWIHLQTFNNYFNSGAEIDGQKWWINATISAAFVAMFLQNSLATRTSNLEQE